MSCLADRDAIGLCPDGTSTMSDISSSDPTCCRSGCSAPVRAICRDSSWTRRIICPGSDVPSLVAALNAAGKKATAAMCVDPATNRPHTDPGCDRPSQCIFIDGSIKDGYGCVEPADCRADSFKCVDGACTWVPPGTAGSGPHGQCGCPDEPRYTCDATNGCTLGTSGTGTDLATCSATCKFYVDTQTGACVATNDKSILATRYDTAAQCAASKNMPGSSGQPLPVWAIVLICIAAAILLGATVVCAVTMVNKARRGKK